MPLTARAVTNLTSAERRLWNSRRRSRTTELAPRASSSARGAVPSLGAADLACGSPAARAGAWVLVAPGCGRVVPDCPARSLRSRRYPPGVIVSRLGGRLVTRMELQQIFTEAAQRPDRRYVDTITVGEDLHLVLPPGQANHYGNHSCDPNLWWADAYTLVAPSGPARKSPATTPPAPALRASRWPVPADRHSAVVSSPARTGAGPSCRPVMAITGYLCCSLASGR
jgi:hypothetical protein